jgi:DNA primase
MPLLEYLRQQNWIGRPAGRWEYVGLCPLHEESRPSFYVNTHKDVFYCHGCGQGGDLTRFLQLSHHLAFHGGLAYLDPTATREKDAIAVLEQEFSCWLRVYQLVGNIYGWLAQLQNGSLTSRTPSLRIAGMPHSVMLTFPAR